MVDFELEWRRPQLGRFTRYSLGVGQLRIDPALRTQLSNLRQLILMGRLRSIWFNPPWHLLQRIQLAQHLRVAPGSRGTQCRVSPPISPSGSTLPQTESRSSEYSEEDQPDIGIVLNAIWAIPCVQTAVDNVLERVTYNFRHASTAEQAVAVGYTLVLGGTALAAIIVDDETRPVLRFLEGNDIPIPGTNGLFVSISDRGGGAGGPIPYLPGVSARAGVSAPRTSGRYVDYNVSVTFDIARWIRTSGHAF